MNIVRKKVFLWLTIVVVSLSLNLFSAFADDKKTAGKKGADEKAIVVNGNVITKQVFNNELKMIEGRFAMQGQKIPKDKLDMVKKKVMDNLISQELLYEQSIKKKISISDATVDKDFTKQKKQFPTTADFDKMLGRMGLTEVSFKKMMKRGLAIKELIKNEVMDKIKVPSKEIKEFYDAHPEYFKKPEQVKASHILIKVEKGADKATKEKALEKIKDVEKKLKEGKDFAVLAKEFSEGPSNVKGGELGYFGRKQMVKPFEEVAFKMKSGEISGIVETVFGYHIIKVTDRKKEAEQKFAEVKEKITQHLKRKEEQKKVEAYISKLKKSAKIENFIE